MPFSASSFVAAATALSTCVYVEPPPARVSRMSAAQPDYAVNIIYRRSPLHILFNAPMYMYIRRRYVIMKERILMILLYVLRMYSFQTIKWGLTCSKNTFLCRTDIIPICIIAQETCASRQGKLISYFRQETSVCLTVFKPWSERLVMG